MTPNQSRPATGEMNEMEGLPESPCADAQERSPDAQSADGKRGRWVFDHCQACAENDEGLGPNAAGDGCLSDGPHDGCEAVWRLEWPRGHRINLADLGFHFRLSDEARAAIEANERRSLQVLATANRYWFR